MLVSNFNVFLYLFLRSVPHVWTFFTSSSLSTNRHNYRLKLSIVIFITHFIYVCVLCSLFVISFTRSYFLSTGECFPRKINIFKLDKRHTVYPKIMQRIKQSRVKKFEKFFAILLSKATYNRIGLFIGYYIVIRKYVSLIGKQLRRSRNLERYVKSNMSVFLLLILSYRVCSSSEIF